MHSSEPTRIARHPDASWRARPCSRLPGAGRVLTHRRGRTTARENDMPTPTIVLVHGAWADGSSWNAVAPALRERGSTVLAPPNLLREPAGDAAYIASFLAQRTSGPVVLVGHSYGGFVISHPRTGGGGGRGLGFVGAVVPGEGGAGVGLLRPSPAALGGPA